MFLFQVIVLYFHYAFIMLLLCFHYAFLGTRLIKVSFFGDVTYLRTIFQIRGFLCLPGSRFKLNVSAGSQKRTIHKPEGKDEFRFSLKSKRNRNVTTVKYILSLLGQIVSLLGQTNCVGLRTLCQKRLLGDIVHSVDIVLPSNAEH